MPETSPVSPLEVPELEGVRTSGEVLYRGGPASRAAVRAVQVALARVGLPLDPDGAFGPRTEAAVQAFQAWAGLPDHGRFDDRTLFALEAALEQGARVPAAPPAQPAAEPARGIYPNDRFGKRVALTFDDGPSPRFTPAVLDLLKERGLRATFFVVGRAVKAHPDLVARAAAEGHTIGNHSFSHPQLGKLTAAQIDEELSSTHAAVDAALGHAQRISLARPPYGDPFFGGSAERKERVAAALRRAGYDNILWNVDSRDWAHRGAPDQVIDEVRRGLSPARGGVVLLHDVHGQSLGALPGVLRLLEEGGYTVVTVAELLAEKYGPAPSAVP